MFAPGDRVKLLAGDENLRGQVGTVTRVHNGAVLVTLDEGGGVMCFPAELEPAES